VDDASEAEVELWAADAAGWALEKERVPTAERSALLLSLAPRVRRSLRADSAFLPEYTPAAAEWSFGGEDGPEVKLGPYHLRGRVDRVDTSDTSAVVIDYKLGNVAKYAAAKFQNSKVIQAPLYAHAVEKGLNLSVAGAFYRGLGDGATRGIADAGSIPAGDVSRSDNLDTAEYRAMIEWALETALEAAEGIRSGVIDRHGGAHCSYCPVLGWCEEEE